MVGELLIAGENAKLLTICKQVSVERIGLPITSGLALWRRDVRAIGILFAVVL